MHSPQVRKNHPAAFSAGRTFAVLGGGVPLHEGEVQEQALHICFPGVCLADPES